MSGYSIKKDDIDLLKNQGMTAEDLEHSIQVAEKAIEIGSRIRADLYL